MVKIFKMPSDTEAERDALVSPPNGTMLYNSDRGVLDYTADNGITWRRLDYTRGHIENIVYVSTHGNDITGRGTYGDPFATLSHAVSTITTSSFVNAFVVQVLSGSYTDSGTVDVPPGVTINGGGSVYDLSGGILQLRSAEWTGITEGFFNLINFFNLSLPATVTLDMSATSGDNTTILFDNITLFGAIPTVTITGSTTNYSSVTLQNLFNVNSLFILHLNNTNILSNNINTAEFIINETNGNGYQVTLNNSTINDVFQINVDGALSAAVTTCNSMQYDCSPVFSASNSGDIVYSQTSCSGGVLTFDNSVGAGTISASLGVYTNVPVLVGTPTVSYSLVAQDNTIVNGNSTASVLSPTINVGTNSTNTAMTLGNPNSVITMPGSTINVGDYSGAGTSGVVLSGGTVSANTAGAPTLTLDGGSEATTLGGADTTVSGNNTVSIASGSDSHLNLTPSSAALESLTGNIDINASGIVAIFGDNGITLNTPSASADITAGVDVTLNPSNALQVTAGGNVNITSSGTDIVLTASSGSIQLNGSSIGMFGGGPVGQSPPIADATILLSDVVTQFNTLLAYLRSRGDIET